MKIKRVRNFILEKMIILRDGRNKIPENREEHYQIHYKFKEIEEILQNINDNIMRAETTYQNIFEYNKSIINNSFIHNKYKF